MASVEGVGDSLDFDFFETPRDQNESEEAQKSSPASKPPKHPQPAEHADNHSKRSQDRDGHAKVKSPPKKASERLSDSDSYSSDYSVSDSDGDLSRDKDKSTPTKDKRRSRGSLSDSSFSDSGSDTRSRSGSQRSGSRRTRSNSSVSSNSEGKRPSNPTAKASSPQQVMPKRGRSRLGEDEYSSSAYSEGEDSAGAKSPGRYDSGGDKNSARRDKPKQRQAWGESVSNGNRPEDKQKSRAGRTRPKTAKNRAADSTTSTSDGRRRRKSRSDSDALSDSDITDVSPMESPRASTSNNNRGVSASGDGSRRMGRKPPKFMAMPVNGLDLGSAEDGGDDSSNAMGEHGRGGTSSNLDLEILMKAVGELEKQKRVQANSRRVMFAPMMSSGARDKGNYTFDEGKTRDIERENQRLLNEIVRRVNSGTDQRRQFYASPTSAYKLTPSAINRERDMKRIESENMAFLKRLQKVKPTTHICRDHQLQSYENTTLHGVPIAALHPLPGRSQGSRSGSSAGGRRRSGASSVADSASSIGSRTRSMTSIHSAVSSVRSSKRGSRPSSATVRPGSATKRLDTRPEWSDRW